MTQFSPQVVQLHIKDFAKRMICDGHLFLQAANRRYYIMAPGVFIDPGFVQKHTSHGTTFEFQSVLEEDVKIKFIQLLKELKYLHFERDLKLKTLEIVSFFHQTFVNQHHFLNWSMALFESFYDLPLDHVIRIHDTDLHLFRKALYSASFSVIAAMCNDFYNPLMLKDFFNLTLLLDIGLCEGHYSYFVAQAYNEENQNPGSGLEWLRSQQASEEEISVYLNHPQQSHKFFKKYSHLFSFPELTEIALYQHELSDGKGFPRGIPHNFVSSWESVVLLADSMVDIQEKFDFENNVLEYLLNFNNHKLNQLPVLRVYQKLCSSLKYVSQIKKVKGYG